MKPEPRPGDSLCQRILTPTLPSGLLSDFIPNTPIRRGPSLADWFSSSIHSMGMSPNGGSLKMGCYFLNSPLNQAQKRGNLKNETRKWARRSAPCAVPSDPRRRRAPSHGAFAGEEEKQSACWLVLSKDQMGDSPVGQVESPGALGVNRRIGGLVRKNHLTLWET